MKEEEQTIAKKTYVPQPPLRFNEAVQTCMRKYFDFTGRARGSEYWYFCLFCILIFIVASLLDIYLFGSAWEDFFMLSSGSGPLYIITYVVLFIPQIAAAARRLNDSNKSGWRLLWILTIIGIPFVLYWTIIKGDTDKNSYDLDQ